MICRIIKITYTVLGIVFLTTTLFTKTLTASALTLVSFQDIPESEEDDIGYKGRLYQEVDLLRSRNNNQKKEEEETGYSAPLNWMLNSENEYSADFTERLLSDYKYDSLGISTNQMQNVGNRTTETPPPPPEPPDLDINRHLAILCFAGLALAVFGLKKNS